VWCVVDECWLVLRAPDDGERRRSVRWRGCGGENAPTPLPPQELHTPKARPSTIHGLGEDASCLTHAVAHRAQESSSSASRTEEDGGGQFWKMVGGVAQANTRPTKHIFFIEKQRPP